MAMWRPASRPGRVSWGEAVNPAARTPTAGAGAALLGAIAMLAMIPIASLCAAGARPVRALAAGPGDGLSGLSGLSAPAADQEAARNTELCGRSVPLVAGHAIGDAQVRACVETGPAGRSARAYYRNDTGQPVDVTLSLVRSNGTALRLACHGLGMERSGSCETLPQLNAGGGSEAIAVASVGATSAARAESGQTDGLPLY